MKCKTFLITFHWYWVNSIFSLYSYHKWWVRISDIFVFNCRGDWLSYFRKKRPSVSFNYNGRSFPKQNYSHFKIFQQFYSDFIYLDPFHPLLLKLHKFFIITFCINILVFFSFIINCILLNILKFLKAKFSNMRW